ncbi:hypothetical protein MLD38_024551 [Melastoma candidum]|uniref:Uncharacterized protein n=1 Tax=Melastoma candidum TaxID=119954 RepID=A0ACB9NTZ5_9MYRT|nr:hypothetical protein MLD38_024551 [Melastoma candidum]
MEYSNTTTKQLKTPGTSVKCDEKHAPFVRFSERHRKLLNVFVRQNPALLEKSFSLLLKVPRFIEFDNKCAHFRSKIKHRHDHRHSPLRISARRAYILEDSYNQLRLRSTLDLKGRLTVNFQGEEGIDAGGLTREWHQLLSRVGKALFDSEAIDPHYFKNLKWMLEKDITDVPDLTFSIDADEEKLILYERTKVTDHELIPNGRNIKVTEENKHQYVDLVAEHRRTMAIHPQINAFLEVPLEGFSALQGISGSQKFQIHKAYGSPDHLPSAHTCFNQLDMPEYPSKEQLEERLLLAIHGATMASDSVNDSQPLWWPN